MRGATTAAGAGVRAKNCPIICVGEPNGLMSFSPLFMVLFSPSVVVQGTTGGRRIERCDAVVLLFVFSDRERS